PSTRSLLGLVRHLTQVERVWLAERFLGEPELELYGPGDADFEVTEADEESVAATFARYAEVAAACRRIVAEADLDAITAVPHARTGEHFSLRWILIHLVEEYARHNGHADLLREAIDGAVGE
ncbi:MAG TPA: DinB family protein, partial [Jatrophihabitans sp.]|nr:DinB family protein [Jatrophihabitans sp.]